MASPNESAPESREEVAVSGSPTTPISVPNTEAEVRKRSQAIAWGSGLFLALGLGIPIGFALHDWRAGAVVGLAIGLLTVVGYLKAGSSHAERRAEHFRDMYSREDQEDEDDDGSYN